MTYLLVTAATAVRLSQIEYADPEPWRSEAKCKGVSLDVFFPPPSGPGQYDAARVICSGCPVRDECLDDALLHAVPWHDDGFRGGKTPRQRAELRGRVKHERRRCRHCGQDFIGPKSREAIYCGQTCRNAVRALRMRTRRESRAK